MFYFKACHMLLSKSCIEKDYSHVLTMVKLVNMSCDKILNEVSFVKVERCFHVKSLFSRRLPKIGTGWGFNL